MKSLRKFFNKTDVLCVASYGGHWTQLKLITKDLQGNKAYISTARDLAVENLYVVNNASASDKAALIYQFFKVLALFMIIRPRVIISTGASIGLVSIFVGRLFFCKTIWVDSIANYETLSRSGMLARKFAHKTLSQWPHVAEKYDDVSFHGGIL